MNNINNKSIHSNKNLVYWKFGTIDFPTLIEIDWEGVGEEKNVKCLLTMTMH